MKTQEMTSRARQAALKTALLDGETKNKALAAIAEALADRSRDIIEANQVDLARSTTEGLAAPLLKRLRFDQGKLEDVISGLKSLTKLADPVGSTLLSTELADGLDLFRVSCPIGVLGIIFESRPDALVQISSLALKSGNTVLLKGGSEAMETNRILARIIDEASQAAGLPDGWIGLLETRSAVGELLSLDEDVDLLIPRGSNEFVKHIMDNTRIPVLGHADGVCHLYIDAASDPDMAIRLAVDSKTQYTAVCNAVETILVHDSHSQTLLPELARALRDAGVEIFGCDRTCGIIGCEPVTDWHTEYLDYKVSIRLVDSMADAIDHINQYGSGHTEAIVTSDEPAAQNFLRSVDAGNVFWNCSTRFSDGFRYGFGAEVGISTSKIHARGPVGLEGLVTYQYRLLGHGQTVGDFSTGRNTFSHKSSNRKYPL